MSTTGRPARTSGAQASALAACGSAEIAKSMPDANHYLRIAARTPVENRQLVDALRQLS